MIINLLPTEEKKMLRRRYYAKVILVSSLFFALLMFLATAGLLPPFLHLQYAIIDPAKNKTKIDGSSASTTSLAFISDGIKEINTKIAIVNGINTDAALTKQSVLIARIINALDRATRAASAKSTISNLHFIRQSGDEKTKTPATYAVSVSGIAENRTVLQQLTKELARTEGIINVDTPISNYIQGKNSSFTISAIAR